MKRYPVEVSSHHAFLAIDIFAGPGGLSEGFAFDGARHGFRVALSIENDRAAHRTLELRSFFRQFGHSVPAEYYQYLRGAISREDLFHKFPEAGTAAGHHAWLATLGVADKLEVRARIDEALAGEDEWALLGGPPCQAYSLVGRSRMRPVLGDEFERDHRHFLYREYLRIVADHRPAVFVFENVRGILSSTMAGGRIFELIRKDLESPASAFGTARTDRPRHAPRYRLYSLAGPGDDHEQRLLTPLDDRDFVVRSERYGVPQARHRVIILGIREDWIAEHNGFAPRKLRPREPVAIQDVIGDLPELRSGASKGDRSFSAWRSAVSGTSGALSDLARTAERNESIEPALLKLVERSARAATKRDRSQGDPRFTPGQFVPVYESDWFHDPKLNGVCNHSARSHMPSDIQRYLFAASYAKQYGRSPKLNEFPAALLPAHANVARALEGGTFADRFRVQVRGRPATTITSHISKDGHYFIHYDPTQCRSLTVREAARIQTFPDNYFFEGNRTQQYVQVGNAVPPLLARQIADIVYDVLAWPMLKRRGAKSTLPAVPVPVAQMV